MVTLGIDSSDEFVSIGILKDDGIRAEFISKSSIADKKAKVILHQFLVILMEEANLKLSAINGVAVAIGPGSFTGLRVGLAAAKGICWALNLPLAGVSSLMAIARCSLSNGKLVAIKNAKRNELYYAAFFKDGDAINRHIEDTVGSADSVLKLIDDGYVPVGPGREELSALDPKRFPIDRNGYDKEMLGGAVAMIGQNMILQGKNLDLASATPNYVRIPHLERIA
jgi:tRNA threonylcarbamoyladenosine biosynthesis protein TsaB